MLVVDLIIIAVARLFGALMTRLGQPAVIGEILAGIVLGPTLMGGSLNAALFPADVRPVLSWLANVGMVAWTLLAVVTAMVGAAGPAEWRIVLVVPYLVLMAGAVRPLLSRLAERRPEPGRAASAGILLALGLGSAGSAALTSWMGLHAIFGAFLFGWVMPRSGLPRLRERVLPRLVHASSNVLLPIFFAVAGFSVDLSTMDIQAYAELALVLTAAVVGKFAGTFVAAKAVGVSTRPATVLATLLNTAPSRLASHVRAPAAPPRVRVSTPPGG